MMPGNQQKCMVLIPAKKLFLADEVCMVVLT